MAVSESSRLSVSLKKENVPVKRLIVNQILPPSVSDCKFCAVKRKVFIFYFHRKVISRVGKINRIHWILSRPDVTRMIIFFKIRFAFRLGFYLT